MAFKRTVTPTIRVDVTVNVPNDKGTTDKNTFVAFFERPTSTTEMDELRSMKFVDVVRQKLKGWEMKDEETKESVPFTPEELEAVLSIEPTPSATATAFFEALAGARAKNSR
ncbi:MAG: hypothetical protein KKG67_20410 [Gammaproteobacteria bacterium]|nr:hypothetical protein [Gammaproteobacteria bacterium]